MPFDTILNVGRTPQITGDYVTTPYTNIYDVANKGQISFNYTGNATLSTPIGNLINENYTTSDQVIFDTINTGAGTYGWETVLDLGRVIGIGKAFFRFFISVTSGGAFLNGNVNTRVWLSNDGVNYTIFWAGTIAYSGIGTWDEGFYELNFYKFFRYLKFEHQIVIAGGAGNLETRVFLNTIKLYPDYIQNP